MADPTPCERPLRLGNVFDGERRGQTYHTRHTCVSLAFARVGQFSPIQNMQALVVLDFAPSQTAPYSKISCAVCTHILYIRVHLGLFYDDEKKNTIVTQFLTHCVDARITLDFACLRRYAVSCWITSSNFARTRTPRSLLLR